MNRVWPLVLTLATATPAAAQMASGARPETVSAMQRLQMMVGEWEGASTTRMGPSVEQHSTVREKASYRAGGEMLIVEGIGTLETDDGDRVIHDAYGAVTWNEATGSYEMRSYRAGQGWVDAELVVEETRVQWGFETPAGSVRFTADFSDPDRWIETGEIQRGGEWMTFLRMELERVR